MAEFAGRKLSAIAFVIFQSGQKTVSWANSSEDQLKIGVFLFYSDTVNFNKTIFPILWLNEVFRVFPRNNYFVSRGDVHPKSEQICLNFGAMNAKSSKSATKFVVF